MEYLAVLIDLKNRPVLVVGGGVVASRKVRMLNCSGAKVKITSTTLCHELLVLVNGNKIEWIGKKFHPSMLDKVFLVVVATDNKALSSLVFRDANRRHILVNVVDDKSKCSFIFPAIIDRNPILVAVSSCGKAPVLTRILREKLESLLPNFLGVMASLAGSYRRMVKKCIFNIVERRRFWENMFCGVFADLIAKGQLQQANKVLLESLNSKTFVQSGSVALVGAGPGDSGLLTLRGLQLIQQADVVLYDYLVGHDVLNMIRRDAKCICVGKRVGDNGSIPQSTINNLLIKFANAGNRVVRLKGGDPLIFGRGGEELEKIVAAGISFQIVPGITAASGAAAYAGIPLTHRNYSHGVVIISGHSRDSYDKLNWKMLSCQHQTLVVYMGTMNVSKISDLLINYGRNVKTPVAIISRATCQDQQVLVVQLEQLQILSKHIVLPALLIIGEVVLFYVNTNWFSQQNFKMYRFNSIVKLF